MKHLKYLLFAACLFATLVACNKNDAPDNIVPVESVTITPEQIVLVVGQTHQLVVTVLPENATDKNVKWSTSDTSIASIDNGVITANVAGTAIVTAKAGGKETTCTVNVAEKVIPVTSVSIEPQTLEMIPGQTATITSTVLPENATDKTVVWTSSEETVATVSDTGLVKAVTEGTATISATSIDGEISGECQVTVMATENMTGSRQDVITQDDFGGSGSAGDDLSGGSGASHGDEDSNKNGISYVYGKNTVAVTNAVMEKISNLTENGFSLPTDSQGRSSIGRGDVFVFPKSEQFPGGYAAKVTDITWDGDGFYYKTTLATIDEIFETLHLEQTAMDLSPYIEKIVREDGTEVEWAKTKSGFSISIPEVFGGIIDSSFDLGDNVQISPSAEILCNLDIDADVDGHKLKCAKVQANSSVSVSTDISISKGHGKSWESKRVKVIIAAIPVGPLLITPEGYVSFEVKLSGEVNMTFNVNYQKSYYAYTYYDDKGGFDCKGGELSATSKKDPFAVSGSLSGGVEFGPNVGVGVSIYGGALGIGVSLSPHAACEFTGSLSFTTRSFDRLDRSWLSNAYYEPSLSLSFGGYVDLAYLWHKDYDLPDDTGLSYSFGKTFIIPKLVATYDKNGRPNTFSIETSKGGNAKISTTIKNKSLFCDNIYVVIREDGPNGQILFKCPFTIPRKPAAEDDEVKITTIVRDLEPNKRYYVDGPFITLTLPGLTKEVEMTPINGNRSIFITDEGMRAIDLGLSVKWASSNVGASAPEECGDHFAWGETTPISENRDYKWYNGSGGIDKYCFADGKTVLDLEDDAANVNWGGSWRMPTPEEWHELWTECESVFLNNIFCSGVLMIGPNGSSIVLPFEPYKGFQGFYWSSSLVEDFSAYGCTVLEAADYLHGFCIFTNYSRSLGFLVRPVTE